MDDVIVIVHRQHTPKISGVSRENDYDVLHSPDQYGGEGPICAIRVFLKNSR